jgi:hypothetical protein
VVEYARHRTLSHSDELFNGTENKEKKMLNNELSQQWSHDYACTENRKQAVNLQIHYEIIGHYGYKYEGEKNKGECHEIVYGFSPSPFGDCMIASTQHGICSLMFESETGKDGLIEKLRAEWPKTLLKMDNQETKKL